MYKLEFTEDIDVVTIEDCLECQDVGIDVYLDEGSRLTFEISER